MSRAGNASKVLWVLTIVGALYGGFEFFNTLANATSAPQQAAGAAMALGWAVLPYVLARAVSELGGTMSR